MPLFNMLRVFTSRETGTTLLEAVVALAVVGTIAVAFLNGLTMTSQAAFAADKHATAESLAQSQIGWAKSATYVYEATEYSTAPIPSGEDYTNYSANITAEPLNNPDDGIQKITVTVKYSDEEIFTLENYKVDR